jgi:NIPSNAP
VRALSETCRVVELRRYALRPGARETLIELFDRELVEPQEAVGMRLLGQFRDLDDADSFVWLRGFTDMGARQRGLEAFYGGPVWKAHSRAANATMVAVDNVLLLRPLSGLELDSFVRPAGGTSRFPQTPSTGPLRGQAAARPGSTAAPPGLVVVTIYRPAESDSGEFPDFFARELEPALREAGISVVATYVSEHSPNTYPALPVRDEDVFVWMTLFVDEADHARRLAELERSPAWRDRLAPALAGRLDGHAETLRLRPTARSLLRG